MKSNLYISRKVLNTQDIFEWVRAQGFCTMMPEDSLHVTVVFCKEVVDWAKIDRDQPEMIFLDFDEGARSVHNFDGGACVLEFKSDELIERNGALKEKGIRGNHPEYRSHVTITYMKPEGLKVSNIEPYSGCIVLGPEVMEPINDNWKNSTDEIPFVDEAKIGGESLTEQRLDEVAGSYSMFCPKTRKEVLMYPRGIDHGEYIYYHAEEFGLTTGELLAPETNDAMTHNINAAFTKGWVRVNNYRGAWFFNATDVKYVHTAAVYYTKGEHFLEEIVADIGPDARTPLKAFTLTKDADINRFIRSGRLPDDIARWLAE